MAGALWDRKKTDWKLNAHKQKVTCQRYTFCIIIINSIIGLTISYQFQCYFYNYETCCDWLFQGVPSLTSVATVTVMVADVNDNAPEFERTIYSLSVSEATPVGTSVGRVYATSRDVGVNADISYSIVDFVSSDFDVNSKTGKL